jgi:hypothetical protein
VVLAGGAWGLRRVRRKGRRPDAAGLVPDPFA